MSDFDSYMGRAIELAQLGRFKTCPNPTVGAVLVRDTQIVAEGWHHAFGKPHAEIECLRDAEEKGIPTQGATMVVTLEPCRHYGKTPPCTEAILKAGISTLVYGARDPDARAGGGAALLENAGLEVIGPVLEMECLDLIADFLVWQTTDRPYIYLKLASSLDGRIATRNGQSRWITGKKARESVHALRASIGHAGGAILVGGGTFRADNPELTARDQEADRQPLACILTSRLPREASEFKLLQERPEATVFFVSPAAAASRTAESLREIGCRIFAVNPVAPGLPDFGRMFHIMRKDLGCYYILCEGGGKLSLSLLEQGFVDEFHLYYAPIILGDNNAKPLFTGLHPLTIDDALKLRLTDERRYGADLCMVLRPDI